MTLGGWRVVDRGSPQERGKAVMGVEVGFREMLCVMRGSMDGMSVREMWDGGSGEEWVLRAEARARLCEMLIRVLWVVGFWIQSADPTSPLPAPSSSLRESIELAFALAELQWLPYCKRPGAYKHGFGFQLLQFAP